MNFNLSRVTHYNRSVKIHDCSDSDYRMKNKNTGPLLQYCFRCTVGFSFVLIYIHITTVTTDHQGWKTLYSWIINESIAVNGKYRKYKAIFTIQILYFNICEIRSWENLRVDTKYRLVMDQPATHVDTVVL